MATPPCNAAGPTAGDAQSFCIRDTGHDGNHKYADWRPCDASGPDVDGSPTRCALTKGHDGGHSYSTPLGIPDLAPSASIRDEAVQCPYVDTATDRQCQKSRNHASDHRFAPLPESVGDPVDLTPTRWSLTDEMPGTQEAQLTVSLKVLLAVQDGQLSPELARELIHGITQIAQLAEAAGAKR